DGARLFGLAFTAREGPRVHRRAGTEQWVVGRRDSGRQHERVEVDIPGGAGVVALHALERYRADIHLFPVGRPGDGSVIGGIAWLPNDDDQPPLQRLTENLGDQL